MIICAISDTHRQSPPLPEADLLIHAGDLGSYGTAAEIMQELTWLGMQKSRFQKGIVYVPGNHDIALDKELVRQEWAKYQLDPYHCHKPGTTPEESEALYEMADRIGIKMLVNQAIEIDGVKIFGTPYTNQFYDWAFMDNENGLADKFAAIPDNTQILVSHGPAYERRDLCRNGHVGSQALRYIIDTRLPELKAHIFGHIHESAGVEQFHYTCWNASVLDGRYWGFNPIHTLDTTSWALQPAR